MGVNYGLSVSGSGQVCECKGWLYLYQDRGVSVRAGCIQVKTGV
jgi:hypothetical protein